MSTLKLRPNGSAPTAEEIASAEACITDNDKKTQDSKIRSKMECLKTWSKNNHSAEDHAKVTASRGSERMGYLKDYLILMLKQKGVIKKRTIDEVHTSETNDRSNIKTENSEKMNDDLGKDRATMLRQMCDTDPTTTPGISWSPCPYTGAKTDPMRLWTYTIKSTVTDNRDKNIVTTSAVTDATVDDAKLFDKGGSNEGPKVEVKAEVLTREEILAKKTTLLRQDPKTEIKKLKDLELTFRDWIVKIGADVMKQPLKTEAEKALPKLLTTMKTLDHMVWKD